MLKLAAYLTGFASKSDGSASIRFATQELSAEDFSALKRVLNAYGFLVFKENQIDASDIPTEDAEDSSKTPSKRLRATLFILWRQRGERGDFEAFYREQMEKVITAVKAKLE